MLGLTRFLQNKNKYPEIFKDGTLHLSLTRQCNAQCAFCSNNKTPNQGSTMPKTWLYKYFLPLYQQAKLIILTGGECTSIQEGLRFCKFIYTNYPNLSIVLQTNGIAFNQEWQKLAIANLMYVKFSLNAAIMSTYCRGVWPGASGKKAFQATQKNLHAYILRLKKQKRLVFAPGLSMVINKNTAKEIRPFIKMSLEIKATACFFYFDIKENDLSSGTFASPQTSIPALIELLKISRLLRKSYISIMIFF